MIKTINLPERTSSTQTHTITLPSLVAIKAITSNRGSVTVKSIDGDKVTVEVKGASYTRRVQTGGSYTASDSKFVTNQSSPNYNSGGYSGTLSSYVASGSYTPADSKTVTTTKSANYEDFQNYFELLPTQEAALQKVGLTSSLSYDSGGYKGTLNRVSVNASGDSIVGNYSGTVTKPASDTRYYRYEGTVTKPASDTRTYDYYYQYDITVEYEDNTLPTLTLSTLDKKTLYEKDTLGIDGSMLDTDKGDTVTVRYQINSGTPRAITAYLSDGTKKEFSKTLTFKAGALYDGDTLVADALKDGDAHLLKVWATDDKGGQSAIVERTFYVVPNRAPRLEVTPPTIEGNIDSDTFTVSGTYADDDKNEVIISYRINGSISKEVARGTDGTFDFTLSLAQLKNGNNTISVEAIDSYGAKTSRTIKMSKNTIATPLLQSTVRYLIQPPKGAAQAVLLWLQRDQELAVTASLHMGMKGEAEAFTLLEPTNTAPLRDNAAILEDEFYHEADSAKDHIILQLDMKRSSVESTAAIHLISGVFE